MAEADDITQAVRATIFIGAKSANATSLAGWDAIAESQWEEIGLAESIPEFGTKWETGSFTPVSDGLKRKYKTVLDNGQMSLVCARDGSDAGQIAAIAASDDMGSYPIMVVLDDKPDGVNAKPTRAYFRALVTSATMNVGGTADAVKTGIGLDITSKVWIGEATVGT